MVSHVPWVKLLSASSFGRASGLRPAAGAPALPCYRAADLLSTRATGSTPWDAMPALAAVAELVDALA